MGSHNVTCRPTQVNATHLTTARQAGIRLSWINQPRRDWRLSWPIGWVRTEMVYPSADNHARIVTVTTTPCSHPYLPFKIAVTT